MPRWMLTPIDHLAEIWNTYSVQRMVVEASAEWEAREKVAETAPRYRSRVSLRSALTSCEAIEER